MTDNIYKKLTGVQNELKAPKGQYNKFGKYNYRSCEDILEAAKPLLASYNLNLEISDTIVQIGDRYYIKAECTLTDCHTRDMVTSTALARESLDKKGMDSSQVTGAASSYARKYALNGLFLIDDTKDADTEVYTSEREEKRKAKTAEDKKIFDELSNAAHEFGFSAVNVRTAIKGYGKNGASELTDEEKKDLIGRMEKAAKSKLDKGGNE